MKMKLWCRTDEDALKRVSLGLRLRRYARIYFDRLLLLLLLLMRPLLPLPLSVQLLLTATATATATAAATAGVTATAPAATIVDSNGITTEDAIDSDCIFFDQHATCYII